MDHLRRRMVAQPVLVLRWSHARKEIAPLRFCMSCGRPLWTCAGGTRQLVSLSRPVHSPESNRRAHHLLRIAAIAVVVAVTLESAPTAAGQIGVKAGGPGPLRGPWKHPALRTRLTIAFGGGQE